MTDAEKKEAKKTADSVYKEWKAGDKTEETFSDLANKESSDSETNTIGGLVKNYRISSGGYNDEFNAWIFSADRKKGDAKVIKADDDGYEIVYFVSNNKDDIDQYDTIRTKMASDKVTENEKALLADDGKYVADVNEKCTIRVMKNFCKTIRSNIAYQNRQK